MTNFIGDLEINLKSGEVKTLSNLKSKEKFILLDFWGSWCKGCTQQLPKLKKLESDYSDKVQIIGLNYGCLLYTSPSPRDATLSRMPSSA